MGTLVLPHKHSTGKQLPHLTAAQRNIVPTAQSVIRIAYAAVIGSLRITPVPNSRHVLLYQTFLLWQLVVFLRTVIGAKKCLFAAGPGAHIVAYVCATGGKTLRVLNGGGDGGSLLELSALRPEDLGGTGKPRRGGEVRKVHDIYLRTCQVHTVAVKFSEENYFLGPQSSKNNED